MGLYIEELAYPDYFSLVVIGIPVSIIRQRLLRTFGPAALVFLGGYWMQHKAIA
jgi:hypothetical protein